MMFKSRLATLVSALVLAGSAFSMSEGPATCPSLSAVQAEGVTNASMILEGFYLDYNASNFGTDNNWFLIMGPIEAESDEEALEEGNRLLTTLSGSASPEENENGDWICDYNSGSQELGVFAVLAPQDMSPAKMKQYLPRVR